MSYVPVGYGVLGFVPEDLGVAWLDSLVLGGDGCDTACSGELKSGGAG